MYRKTTDKIKRGQIMCRIVKTGAKYFEIPGVDCQNKLQN
jgi:hypothetical protein